MPPNTEQKIENTTKYLLQELGGTSIEQFTSPLFLGWLTERYKGTSRGMARVLVAQVNAAINHSKKVSVGLLPPEYHNLASKLAQEANWLKQTKRRNADYAPALENDEWRMALSEIDRMKRSLNSENRIPRRRANAPNWNIAGRISSIIWMSSRTCTEIILITSRWQDYLKACS